MTYCLGWRTDTAVFLVADSAVSNGTDEGQSISSFGEGIGPVAWGRVQETSLKIHLIHGVAVAFSGPAVRGRDILATLEAGLDLGLDPSAALRSALVSHAGSMPEGDDAVQILAAFREEDQPRLLRATTACPTSVHEPRYAHIGSMPENLTRSTDDVLTRLVAIDDPPHRALVVGVGLVQSYGLSNELVRLGIAGAYSGVWVDSTGPHWHADILYLIYDRDELDQPALVFSAFHGNAQRVESNFTGKTRVFTNSSLGPFDFETWKETSGEFLEYKASLGLVGYVVLLAKDGSRICIVETLWERSHPDLKIRPVDDREFRLEFSGDLLHTLTAADGPFLRMIAYQKPDEVLMDGDVEERLESLSSLDQLAAELKYLAVSNPADSSLRNSAAHRLFQLHKLTIAEARQDHAERVLEELRDLHAYHRSDGRVTEYLAVALYNHFNATRDQSLLDELRAIHRVDSFPRCSEALACALFNLSNDLGEHGDSVQLQFVRDELRSLNSTHADHPSVTASLAGALVNSWRPAIRGSLDDLSPVFVEAQLLWESNPLDAQVATRVAVAARNHIMWLLRTGQREDVVAAFELINQIHVAHPDSTMEAQASVDAIRDHLFGPSSKGEPPL